VVLNFELAYPPVLALAVDGARTADLDSCGVADAEKVDGISPAVSRPFCPVLGHSDRPVDGEDKIIEVGYVNGHEGEVARGDPDLVVCGGGVESACCLHYCV